MLPFFTAPREVAGRCLVMVFAATCRHLALRTAWVGEQADAMLVSLRNSSL